MAVGLLLLGSLLGASQPAASAADSNRIALVMGNTAYGGDDVSGRTDALAMADYLTQIGFTVLPPVLDGDLDAMTKRGLDVLRARIQQTPDVSVIVVFYSGHGFQANGTNYLLPVNGDINSSVPLTDVSGVLSTAPEKAVKLVFLDACRNLENLEKLPAHTVTGQQEVPDPPQQTLYFYAAGVGSQALSGSTGSVPKTKSPFTDALLHFIREPGLEIRKFMAQVRAEVALKTGGRQSPIDSGISRLPKEDFFLRAPVEVDLQVGGQVDDDLFVIYGDGVALDAKKSLHGHLTLKAGANPLALMASNGNSFKNGLTWERTEGWGYSMTLQLPNGKKVPCFDGTTPIPANVPCFAGSENYPYKSGPHHGTIFNVAKANLYVNPATAELSVIDRDIKVWEEEAPIKARNQGLLSSDKLVDLPLDDILGAGQAAVVRALLRFVVADPDKLFVTVRGNLLAKPEVLTCMKDRTSRIQDLKASLDAARNHDPRPFDSFDKKLSLCVQDEARKLADPGFPPDQMEVWTALEDHSRDSDPPPAAPVLVGPPEPAPPAGSPGPLEAALSFDPPVTTSQLAAVTAAQDALQHLGGPLLYASLSAADLQAYLPGSLSAQFDSLGVPGTARVESIKTGNQEVVATIAFDITLKDFSVHVKGEAELHCAAVVERGAMQLRSTVPSVHVTQVRTTDNGTNLDALAPVAEEILKGYLKDWTRSLEARRIPLRLTGAQTLDLAGLLTGVANVGSIDAKPVDFRIGIGASALLVDDAGIHVLADAVLLTSDRILATVDQLQQDLAADRAPQFTSNELAVLGECGEPLGLAESVGLGFAAACAAYVDGAHVAAPAPSAPEGAEAALDAAFAQLQNDFRAKVDSVEPVAKLPWDKTVLAVSREQLVAGLNEILRAVSVQATVKPAAISAEIPPEDRTIRTPPSTDLHCDRVGGDCPSVFTYKPYEPLGCPSDCGWDLGCRAWKPICEGLKESKRLKYESDKAAAQVAFAAAKLACETAKAAQQAGCQANQIWLDQTANLDVGELKGGLEVRSIELPLGIDQIHAGGDFDTIALRLTARGGAEVAGHLSVIPHNLGNLVCLAQWDSDLTTQVNLPEQQKTLQLQKTGEQSNDDGLLLTYQLSAVPLQLKIQPPPVRTFLERNLGKFALSCPVPAALAAILPGGLSIALSAREEILRDTFDVELPARAIPLVIPGQQVRISEGKSLRVLPSWGEKAIVFEVH